MVLVSRGPAAAQDPVTRFEVFAGAGVSRVGGDEGSRGTGPAVAGGIGYRLNTAWSTEGVSIVRHGTSPAFQNVCH